METISREQAEEAEVVAKLKQGAVVVYPTDTIYGVGCDGTSDTSVSRVRALKRRPDLPFSVIAPGKDWIRENCHVPPAAEEWLDKLPGPYTLILRLSCKGCISPIVNNDSDTLGVRIPDHWFSGIVASLGRPFVTTSANLTGQAFMVREEDLDHSIKAGIDFMIYEGPKDNRPSTIVSFLSGEPEVIKR